MRLKSLLKTELRITYLSSDDKRFFDEYEAVIYEHSLQEIKVKERRWIEMKSKIAELVCEVIREKQWGIFFKHEPMKALPVQDSASLYKINEVKHDDLVDAIEQALERKAGQWEKPKANLEQNQTERESLNGINQTLSLIHI